MTTWKARIRDTLNRSLRPLDLELVRRGELERLRLTGGRRPRRDFDADSLPAGAKEYLRPTHPRLLELKARYRGHPAHALAQWDDAYVKREIDLRFFRADNAYLYQGRVATEAAYMVEAFYARRADALGLFSRLSDDPLFGNETFTFDGRAVSRDLLDSILEINFLERHLGVSSRSLHLLDVGAGYGRLAHRLAEAFPHATVTATDAVAESTFVCEYYLRFRQSGARVAPLDEVEGVEGAQVATNVHSFSECTRESVAWWVELLARKGVRHLMIVPNEEVPLSTERGGARYPLLPVLERSGYRLSVREPKYDQPAMQRCAAFPAFYYLFTSALS